MWELDLIASIGLNVGQLLSIPFIVAGGYLIFRSLRHPISLEENRKSTSKSTK